MATPKTYTQDQLEAAKKTLEQLPDLSRDKIPPAEFLASLKDQILVLAKNKGYSNSEVKSALSDVGLTVTTKQIAELIGTKKTSPRKSARDNNTPS